MLWGDNEDFFETAFEGRAGGGGGGRFNRRDCTFLVYVADRVPITADSVIRLHGSDGVLTGNNGHRLEPVPNEPRVFRGSIAVEGQLASRWSTLSSNQASIPDLGGSLLTEGSGPTWKDRQTPLFQLSITVTTGTQLWTSDYIPIFNPPNNQTYLLAKSGGPNQAAQHAVADAAMKFLSMEIHEFREDNFQDFTDRMHSLLRSHFGFNRVHADYCFLELMQHWGAQVPAATVLAVASVYGALRSMSKPKGGSSAHAEFQDEVITPETLMVARWLTELCPKRADQDGHDDFRYGQKHFKSFARGGIAFAADCVYTGECSYDWLQVCNYLPTHAMPTPKDPSRVPDRKIQDKLADRFRTFMTTTVPPLLDRLAQLGADNAAAEQALQEIKATLQAIFNYCPNIPLLQELTEHIRWNAPSLTETAVSQAYLRIRNFGFGPNDLKDLKESIKKRTFLYNDQTAIAMLGNHNLPSQAVPDQEIMNLTNMIAGDYPASAPLLVGLKRFLQRVYSRLAHSWTPEVLSRLISASIIGWQMALKLPCVHLDEENSRQILAELAHSPFFKEPASGLLLTVLLNLEPQIEAVSSTPSLKRDLERATFKALRENDEEPDAVQNQVLLFSRPTPLRYVVIETYMGYKQAKDDLARILDHQKIWSQLLVQKWIQGPNIYEFPLGHTLKKGMSLLRKIAEELKSQTVQLKDLRVTLNREQVFIDLCKACGETPEKLVESRRTLKKFDDEFEQLRSFTRVFCLDVESDALESLIQTTQATENSLRLCDADVRFIKLPVHPHLQWLYDLRSSDVFNRMWQTVVAKTRDALGRQPQQDDVVNKVIPEAKKLWETLGKSIEDETAIIKDIDWYRTMEWHKVEHELQLLQKTAMTRPTAIDQAKKSGEATRLAHKLRQFAPAMLTIQEQLSSLFSAGADPVKEEMKQVVRDFEFIMDMTLNKMVKAVAPYRSTIERLTGQMQDYIIKLSSHEELLVWIAQQQSTDGFTGLISLIRPNTDDAVTLAAIASLQQTRTFLASTLYEHGAYTGVLEFIQQLATLSIDDSIFKALVAVQTSFDPLKELLTTHSRTPGVQACYSLKKIHESGYFYVICSRNESEQLFWECEGDKPWSQEALLELRHKLLMTEIPSNLDGASNLPEMLDELVKKLELLEEYGNCTLELFRLGHFEYKEGQRVLTVPPSDSTESVEQKLLALQQTLEAWEEAVKAARDKHYFLNYFSVREICFLVEAIPNVSDPEAWANVWGLLRMVGSVLDESQVQSEIQKLPVNLGPVETLNAVGEGLGRAFEPAPVLVRPLHGLEREAQQLQGDMVIRRMDNQNKERGEPIFVCCADQSSKVTELVLSMYTRRERVPEAEELLFCSKSTSLEEVELLFRRFFSAGKQGRQDRLYCLGNIHLLSYTVQIGAVELLSYLEGRFGFGDASALVLVSGVGNQVLMNALDRHSLSVSLLPREHLMRAVRKVGEMYHGRQIEAVTGEINGAGKTHHIYKEVSNMQEANDNKPCLHHVEIRETTDITHLVQALHSDPTDPSIPTCIYIDLAHILPAHVDTLLFELLVVGLLRDTKSRKVYHRRQQDNFFVEIPNTPQESTAKQLSFCMLLPRTHLRMTADRLDDKTFRFEAREGFRGKAPYVIFDPNEFLVATGKELEAMNNQTFDPKSKTFNPKWNFRRAEPAKLDFVYEELNRICASPESPPSFLIFSCFVKYFGNLVVSGEKWNMFQLNLLINFDQGLKNFKNSFMKLLIETARDFALRQVPKDMAVSQVLAPSPTQWFPSLARQTSNTSSMGLGRAQSSGLQRADSHTSHGGPALHRQRSRREEAPTELEVENSALGRVPMVDYLSRFDKMPAWDESTHPIASFKFNQNNMIIGANIMSLKEDFLSHFIDDSLKKSLNTNDLKLDRSWTQVTHDEAIQLVKQIEGGAQGPAPAVSTDYVVTIDNLLKLITIQQRLRYGLPVILMGETGCGKTALVKFLSQTLNYNLKTLDVHGGITDDYIIHFLDDAIDKMPEGSSGVLVFFDEINASNCMALFKSIIIDRRYGNRALPSNVRIISCCNPYRKRKGKELEDVALTYRHQAVEGASGIVHDEMKDLVYRVHRLPESLVDVVCDFGSLKSNSERLYVRAILERELPLANPAGGTPQDDQKKLYEGFLHAFTELLCESQSFVRNVNGGETSVVSMRDIARAAKVFKWFLTYNSKLMQSATFSNKGSKDIQPIEMSGASREVLREALVLTLGYCYHSRLDRNQRLQYRMHLCQCWSSLVEKDNVNEWIQLKEEKELEGLLVKTQESFVTQMDLGEGIALNEALRENLFMLLVSIMNQIPILLIGKPGCSKSLAMGLLHSNLRGSVSTRPFFKSMPAIDVLAYQCSPLSTPDAILKTFEQARNSSIGNVQTIICVLLDEVGLAEESPHLPLKVLHKELEDLRGIACVGISNWALDAAKMSRCVTLYRPPPTVKDLWQTAQGMVASENLKSYLQPLSVSFHHTYKTQKRLDFWGMRDFYSTVRVINDGIKSAGERGVVVGVEPQLVMKTVQRNFGGRPAQELDDCINIFFEGLSMNTSLARRYSPVELISQNLCEPDARHLMLLTKNNAALRLLFQSGLVDHNKAEVMFGSTFPNDQSDIFVAMNLQRIKTYMQQPISLVLVHCDSLYESLYDLLNQHYMEYAGQRYVRIAHGSKAMKQCPLHHQFRIIVVTEISDAYYRLAPPLLNRFEKQIFLRKDLMEEEDKALLTRLDKFWEVFLEMIKFTDTSDAPTKKGNTQRNSARPIAGLHSELLSSLVFVLRKRHADLGSDELLDMAKRLLTKVLTPEAVCILAAHSTPEARIQRLGFDLVNQYFDKQTHTDLPTFADQLSVAKAEWNDQLGSQVMVLTYSPIRGKVGSELVRAVAAGSGLPEEKFGQQEVSLHELSSSTDIEKAVKTFYDTVPGTAGSPLEKKFLIIHADPAAAPARMIEHCRFVCEKARTEAMNREDASQMVEGSMFVLLVVHLSRGTDTNFSFDFDSQWDFTFLDSVESSADLDDMPSLGKMLNHTLLQVVSGLGFSGLLQGCFRSSLSRLLYPHSRQEEDLQKQISFILEYLRDEEFVDMVKAWSLQVLQTTTRPGSDTETVGKDDQWFSSIAMSSHDLAMAGTFRAALHNRIAVLVGSLFTVLLAHLDRNGGLRLLKDPGRRDLWLLLTRSSLSSPLSQKLDREARQATSEEGTAPHEVGTDAQTIAKPFQSHFPVSWFVSKSLNGVRSAIEGLPQDQQLESLQQQYRMTKLHEIGLQTELEGKLLDDYLADFTAMHLDWTRNISREVQTRVLKKVLTRVNEAELTTFLQIHKWFWSQERQITFCIGLLDAVPTAVESVIHLIGTASLETLNLDLLLSVHRELADCLVRPGLHTDSNSSPNQSYREWLTSKKLVSGLTQDLLTDMGTSEKLNSLKAVLKSDTEPRLETLALFLEHVAIPLSLSVDVVRAFADNLPGKEQNLRHSSSLSAILNIATDICRDKEETDGILQCCCTFMESWLLDVCLRDSESIDILQDDLLILICDLASGQPLRIDKHTGVKSAGLSEARAQDSNTGTGGLATLAGGKVIVRSAPLSLALLRKLVYTAEGSAKKRATDRLFKLLKDAADFEKHNDTAFAMRYCVLTEEAAAKELCSLAPDEWPELSLDEIFSPAMQEQPWQMIQKIGQIRWMLAQYAKVLCEQPINAKAYAEHESAVEDCLMTKVQNFAPTCRSVRLFLLKCIERPTGTSHLLYLLSNNPLNSAKWMEDWRNAHDVDFVKFTGEALVPKWNPFFGLNSVEYKKAKEAVMHVMQSENATSLDAFAADVAKLPVDKQRAHLGALLMALCQEPGLLAAIQEPDRQPVWRSVLSDWLRDDQVLPVSTRERQLLRIFASDSSVINAVPANVRDFYRGFTIAAEKDGEKMTTKSMQELLRWRATGHIIAVILGAPKTSLLAMLRKIMLEPETLMMHGNTYLPAMDEDIRNRVMKALLEKGENIWKQKSHWYKCQCGYNFFIGECGRPMEETKCPQCAVTIGGRDHNATAATKADDENEDRSPQGYMLPRADRDDKHVTFREVQNTSARAFRLLLHTAMYGALGATASEATPRLFSHIVNPDSMCDMKDPVPEAQFIVEHLEQDWKLLTEFLGSNQESLAAGLHDMMHKMQACKEDEPVKGNNGAASSSGPICWEELTLTSRNKWEETMERNYLSKMIELITTNTLEYWSRWGSEDDSKFFAELREDAKLHTFSVEKRKSDLPQLWAFRKPVDLEELMLKESLVKKAEEIYPVLHIVLQRPLLSILPALGCLVGLFRWHSLLTTRFSNRLSRAQAGQMQIRNVLADVRPESEKIIWQRAWEDFKSAWHTAWPHIERHGCLVIPDHFKNVMISEEHSLLFTIMDQNNEGICPTALTEWLAQQHNELVQLVSTAMNRGNHREMERARLGARQHGKVSSRLLSEHDEIKFSEDDLMRFVKSRCVTYNTGGDVNLDLRQVEKHLLREMSRPEITVEVTAFQWLGESQTQSDLKEVIAQKALTQDIEQRIRNELKTPALANTCLQKVQMATSFILKSGSSTGENAGMVFFQEYLSSVLKDCQDLPSSTVKSEIRLIHLVAFEKLLNTIVSPDRTSGVAPKYRTKLPEELQAPFETCAKKLPAKKLTDAMDQIAETLGSESISAKAPLWETLRYLLDEDEDAALVEVSQKTFGEGPFGALLMEHWVEVYQVLHAAADVQEDEGVAGERERRGEEADLPPPPPPSSAAAAASSSSAAAASSSASASASKRW